ncbi:sigma-54 dependent transcriptional regulator [Vibrio algicola]|uniref:Sigma-54-dependent Fis family transcriptional regulator n=1 Tax=Vibrio algicola TaxID=2662262 RepID=A0A5Q0TH88_9VIBR|nr:sigma-54 dependent transcriptional regulator [Vibrio algicola]
MERQFKIGIMPGSLITIGGSAETWFDSIQQTGWMCHRCDDLRLAQQQLEQLGPCIGIIDLCQENLSLNAISCLVSTNKQVRWIAYIKESQLNSDPVRQFIVNYCIDFFTSPMPEKRLLNCIGHQLGMLKLEQKVWPDNPLDQQVSLIGDSLPMKRLREQIKRIAVTDACIIISGEQGSGKTIVAQYIHQYSSRNKGPVVVVNCSALPEQRLEQEVFGHNRTHTTGYIDCEIEKAKGGTLIFKNVTALPLSQQKHLHSLLSANHLGSSQTIESNDVRILATTHNDIEQCVRENTFLSELFFSLNVLKIYVPPLKERCTDINLLAQYYLQQNSREYNSQARTLSNNAVKQLTQYHWPGNVRELSNQIKRAVLMSEGTILDVHHLDLPSRLTKKRNLRTIREDSERNALIYVLESHNGQISPAAKELGVSRATMYRLLGKHNVAVENKSLA